MVRLAAALALTTGLAHSQEAAGGFHGAWYREIISGDIRGAADQYYGLYADTTTESERAGESAKAAFRAGRCQEVLGEISLAEAAYRWLEERGWSETTLRDRARERLRYLEDRSEELENPGAGDTAEAREGGSVRETDASLDKEAALDPSDLSSVSSPTLRGAIREAVRSAWRRADRVRRFSETVEELRRESRIREELLERLRAEGLNLVFRRPSLRPRDAVLAGPGGGELGLRFGEALGEADDIEALRDALIDRLLDAALRSVAAGKREAAASRVMMALRLESSESGAVELLELLADRLSDRTLQSLAMTRMELREAEATARVRHDLRTYLRRAEERLRDDHSFLDLREARTTIHTAPPCVFHDPEVAMLVEKFRHRYRTAGSGSTEAILGELWRRGKIEVSQLLELAVSWTRLMWDEEIYATQPVWRSSVPVETIVRRELRRLLRSRVQAVDASDPRSARALGRQIEYLKAWFPEMESPDVSEKAAR